MDSQCFATISKYYSRPFGDTQMTTSTSSHINTTSYNPSPDNRNLFTSLSAENVEMLSCPSITSTSASEIEQNICIHRNEWNTNGYVYPNNTNDPNDKFIFLSSCGDSDSTHATATTTSARLSNPYSKISDILSNEDDECDDRLRNAFLPNNMHNVDHGKSTKKRRQSSKSNYKHVPHREKPVHLVARRNARERKRVQAVNSAFVRLRKCVPVENRSKRLSKVKTLHRAIEYISALERLLHESDQLDSTVASVVNNNNSSRSNNNTTTTSRSSRSSSSPSEFSFNESNASSGGDIIIDPPPLPPPPHHNYHLHHQQSSMIMMMMQSTTNENDSEIQFDNETVSGNAAAANFFAATEDASHCLATLPNDSLTMSNTPNVLAAYHNHGNHHQQRQ